MRHSVFICGPQGCGKSRHAFLFLDKLGLKAVQDWSPGETWLPKGMLYLTNASPGDVSDLVQSDGADVPVLDFEKAKKLFL